MEFKRKEIEKFKEEAEILVKETLNKISDYEKHPEKRDLGYFEELLYELGKNNGHLNTLEAILKLHS